MNDERVYHPAAASITHGGRKQQQQKKEVEYFSTIPRSLMEWREIRRRAA